jgi:hypothetical protein
MKTKILVISAWTLTHTFLGTLHADLIKINHTNVGLTCLSIIILLLHFSIARMYCSMIYGSKILGN